MERAKTVMSCCPGGETRVSGMYAGGLLSKAGWPWSAIKFREGKGNPVEMQADGQQE
jgi:hypothetical protein